MEACRKALAILERLAAQYPDNTEWQSDVSVIYNRIGSVLESQGNLAGTITGWMDVPLTDFGRKQAFKLSECLADLQVDSVSSSDL
jgi:hypothetical protein